MTDEQEDDEPLDRVVDFSAEPPDRQAWRQRAADYDSQYKGPVHWVRAINAIAATGTISIAMRETGISRNAFNRRRERYIEFAEAVDEAMEHFRSAVLEKAALTRAVDGWLEPVYYKGLECGYVRKYSDTLLTKLLEGNIPEKYRSKTENTPSGSIVITGGLPPDEEEPAAPSATDTAPATPNDDPLD